MKLSAFISGTLFSSLFFLGALFKIMHWPGAGPLLTLGLAGTAIITIPFISIYLYGKDKPTQG